MSATNEVVWRKWELSKSSTGGWAGKAKTSEQDEPNTMSKRTRRLGWIAPFAWTYGLWRLFLGSPEDGLFEQAGLQPWVLTLLKLVVPALLVLLVAAVNRPHWLWGLVYIFFWPAFLLCWRIPRLFWKKGSWNGIFALAHALSFSRGRAVRRLQLFVGWTTASIALLRADSVLVVALASVGAVLLLIHNIVRSYRAAISGASFFAWQVNTVRWLSRLKVTQEMWRADPKWLREEDEPFSDAQSLVFAQRVSTGVVVHRLHLVLAEKIDEYRRSVVPLVMEYMSVVGLVACVVWTFSLVDSALYRLEPNQFQTTGDVTYITFILMAATALGGGNPAAIAAVGPWSQTVAALNLACGVALAGAGSLGLIRVYRSRKDELAGRQAVSDLNAEATAFERDFSAEYEVSLDEALVRLGDTTQTMVGNAVDWLTSQLRSDKSDD